ncbi:adipocyte plasma membrane-associated protein-like [Centruroides sculpturatus]|uniref:adipocyte plasma membrane-associated protein-like n=1 Tax=Centruroides sculpturatus TaxID=218467 RepID=UPI000C6CDEB1|nr:adipocyte plasma membrane-associated protein-like [Centruroides sculpturatus]
MAVPIFFKILGIFLIVYLIFSNSSLNLDFKPVSYKISLPKAFEGPLTVNNNLSDAEHIFEGQITKPESLALLNGVIYTGISDGRIVKIENNKISTVAQIGNKCEGIWEQHKCGRVLGLKFDSKNRLHVVDAYYGVYVIDIQTGKVTSLLKSSAIIDGKQLVFINDVAIDDDGIIYITESSNRWPLSRVLYVVLEHESTGRVIKFDPKTNNATVLIDDLHFPNGIILSHDKKSLLIAETNNHRILKYNLDAKASEKLEVFVEGLPGEPDNLSYGTKNSYWVGLTSGRNASKPNLMDLTSQYPIIKKIFVEFLYFVGFLFRSISQFLYSERFKTLAFEIETGQIFVPIIPNYGMIIEVNNDGEIIKSLHSPDGKMTYISEILEFQNHLYLGSWRNNFLGKLKL